MTNTLKVTEFSAAVRGYHYYDSIWFPEKEEQLDCSHDFGNVFDVFAIKTCKLDGTVVGTCHVKFRGQASPCWIEVRKFRPH